MRNVVYTRHTSHDRQTISLYTTSIGRFPCGIQTSIEVQAPQRRMVPGASVPIAKMKRSTMAYYYKLENGQIVDRDTQPMRKYPKVLSISNGDIGVSVFIM